MAETGATQASRPADLHEIVRRRDEGGRPGDGTCSVYVDLPRNGVGVELRSREFGGVLRDECEARPFDLCAAA